MMAAARARAAAALASVPGLHVAAHPRAVDAQAPVAVVVPQRVDFTDDLGTACAPACRLEVHLTTGREDDPDGTGEDALDALADACCAALADAGVLTDTATRTVFGDTGALPAYVLACTTPA